MSELLLGRWEDVLAPFGEVDLVCTDPPYSDRTHRGHDDGAATANRRRKANGVVDTGRPRRQLSYEFWTADDVDAFVASWAPRCRGWMVCLSDSDLCAVYRAAYERHGLTGFQPVPCLMPGMSVRHCGDGPSSWAVYANVARPKSLAKWGTLPGGYYGPPHNRQTSEAHVGGKPLWLMRALVRDYSRPGDLVVDPCAGYATTLLAAQVEGRRAIGAEVDPETYEAARARMAEPPLLAAMTQTEMAL